MSFQLDKNQRVKEILKCGKDPSYFLNNYARISHPMHGLILFNTWELSNHLSIDFRDTVAMYVPESYRFQNDECKRAGT